MAPKILERGAASRARRKGRADGGVAPGTEEGTPPLPGPVNPRPDVGRLRLDCDPLPLASVSLSLLSSLSLLAGNAGGSDGGGDSHDTDARAIGKPDVALDEGDDEVDTGAMPA